MRWFQEFEALSPLGQLTAAILSLSALLLAVYLAVRVWKRFSGSAREAFLIDIDRISKNDRYAIPKKGHLHIGRAAQPHKTDSLVIPQTTIGRKHASLGKENGVYWVTDLDSLNGTYVNNHPVSGKARLENGDIVMFHEYKFRFVIPGAPSSANEMTQLATSYEDIDSATQLAAAKGSERIDEPEAFGSLDTLNEEDFEPLADEEPPTGANDDGLTLDDFIDDKTISSDPHKNG